MYERGLNDYKNGKYTNDKRYLELSNNEGKKFYAKAYKYDEKIDKEKNEYSIRGWIKSFESSIHQK